MNGHLNEIREIQVLADETAVSCSDHKTIEIWDLTSASCIKSYQMENVIISIDLF